MQTSGGVVTGWIGMALAVLVVDFVIFTGWPDFGTGALLELQARAGEAPTLWFVLLLLFIGMSRSWNS